VPIAPPAPELATALLATVPPPALLALFDALLTPPPPPCPLVDEELAAVDDEVVSPVLEELAIPLPTAVAKPVVGSFTSPPAPDAVPDSLPPAAHPVIDKNPNAPITNSK
jgi:hypothetical protein